MLSTLIDIKVLLGNKSDDSPSHEAAFRKYNELQYATTNLPGGADQVCRIDAELCRTDDSRS